MRAGIVASPARGLGVGGMPARGGGVISIAGPPMASVGAELYVMHYLEAVILGGIAAIAFVVAMRRGTTARGVVSPGFYLPAMFGKEIARPPPSGLFPPPPTRPRHPPPHPAAPAGDA